MRGVVFQRGEIMANYHLCILKKPYLDAILDGGKQVESRFMKTRREPFGRVEEDDRLFLKLSSGPVCAAATAGFVENFSELTPEKIVELKAEYNHLICASEGYWRSKRDCKFGVLVWLRSVRPIEPVRIAKKDWRAWVVLSERDNFGLLD